MQKRNRDITIFNLSALDLFCSGMGAIMIVMVLLMPYYLRPKPDAAMAQLAQLQSQLSNSQTQSGSLQSQLDQLRRDLAAALAAAQAAQARAQSAEARAQSAEARAAAATAGASKPFLTLAISWDTEADIDLHVTDPAGNHFFWDRHRTFPGTPATLEVDSVRGPGNEVWIHPQATPGDYKVEFVFYGWHPRPPQAGQSISEPTTTSVRGVLVGTTGRIALPTIAMPAPPDSKKLVRCCSFRVSADGKVTIIP